MVSPPAEDATYVHRLESQLRVLSETVRALEAQLAAARNRNQELEAARAGDPGAPLSGSERAAAERAQQLLAEAEAGARELTEHARQRAVQVEEQAKEQARGLIAAVEAELDRLERDANLPEAGDEGARRGAEGEADGAAEVRGEIADLLRLREAILLNIRGALDGFGRELDALDQPPLADSDPDAEGAAEGAEDAAAPKPEQQTPAGPAIEVEVSPIAGVLEASRLERDLGELEGANAHLRSVEGETATLLLRGHDPDGLDSEIAARLPAAQCEWAGDGLLRVRLAPGGETKVTRP